VVRDGTWFEDLYRTTRLPVLRYLCRRLPRDQAEDAMSEVYAAAWSGRAGLRGEPLPWLYGIARHTVSRALRTSDRTERVRRAAEAAGEPPVRPAEHEAVDRIGALHALERLGPADREALLLVAWEGLDVREAARAAGCSKGTFTVRLHRARRRRERAMDDQHSGATARSGDPSRERSTR
jgi:RNA polymerase sigma-70 factor, ECF subfamily